MDENDIIRRITANESGSKSNAHRINDLERRQDNLDKMAESMEVMTNEMGHIKSDVQETKSDIKELKAKPAKRWDSIVDKIIMTVVGAVIAYVLMMVELEGGIRYGFRIFNGVYGTGYSQHMPLCGIYRKECYTQRGFKPFYTLNNGAFGRRPERLDKWRIYGGNSAGRSFQRTVKHGTLRVIQKRVI